MAQRLPPFLLELTLLRLSGQQNARFLSNAVVWRRALTKRRMHSVAHRQQQPPPQFDEFLEAGVPAYSSQPRQGIHGNGSMAVRTADNRDTELSDPIRELERRVRMLEEPLEEAPNPGLQPLAYSEADLLSFYEDILANPDPEDKFQEESAKALLLKQKEEDREIVAAMVERFSHLPSSVALENASVNRKILIQAHEMVAEMERTRKDLGLDVDGQPIIPTPVLTARECHALVRTSIAEEDEKAAELALQIIKRTGLSLPDGAVTDILKLHAETGNSEGADRLLTTYVTETPTEDQRHYHIKAHLKHGALETLPTSALDLLHHYESQGVPAPMKTYTKVITSLFSRETSLARAHAWDMFAHMRYVAHPNPDQLLYSHMIRACASPVSSKYSSEPEKALDFWTEMTVDHKIAPSVGSYNAIILACARSGKKEYVNEGFRLARQMLDSNRDAYGVSAFRPDKKTFCALLDGVKRIGDLGRARWILAEMVKGSSPPRLEAEGELGASGLELDEEIMTHMFHAYAAYKPPLFRSAAKMVRDTSTRVTSSSTTEEDSTDVVAMEEGGDEQPSFAIVPPQSKTEVIREARYLFERILESQSSATSSSTSQTPPQDQAPSPIASQAFQNVTLTPRLLNSYLSIHYRHGDLSQSQRLFWTLFDDLNLSRTARSYVEALERCANSSLGVITDGGKERDVALGFAREIWSKWEVMEKGEERVPARLVERMHATMIRVLAITDNLDEAMAKLRHFATVYPPEGVRKPHPKHPSQSPRISLEGNRPLVRMTSVADVPDDYVPPLMTFRDLEVLHHRLVDECDRQEDIRYIKWLCKAYEWALRNRRNETMRAWPTAGGSTGPRGEQQRTIEGGQEKVLIEEQTTEAL